MGMVSPPLSVRLTRQMSRATRRHHCTGHAARRLLLDVRRQVALVRVRPSVSRKARPSGWRTCPHDWWNADKVNAEYLTMEEQAP